MKFSEIISHNQCLKKQLGTMDYKIAILSNIIVSQSQYILEYVLRSNDIKVEAILGDYDNIVQDSKGLKDANCVIIFWELANIIDGFQYKVEIMSDAELQLLVDKTKDEIAFCLENLKNTQLVIFNRFSSLIFGYSNIRKNRFDKVCSELNNFLEGNIKDNTILIDIDKIIARTGIYLSVDLRYFYSSKALYSILFYKEYAKFISSTIISANGKAKKALIFDCDNTLWSGIIGEDGEDGIVMSSKLSGGAIFEEIQTIAVNLAKNGVVIGLCSKNNFSDVQSVIDTHPDMLLRDEYIAIKKINWEDKPGNLKAIASELNIGLDSIVFIDDSDFEIDSIKEQLPMVTLLQVPKKLSEYPRMLRENIELFFNLSNSKEDLQRTIEYKNQSKREEAKSSFENMQEYLRSLDIKIKMHKNNSAHIARVAQLAQKTNQFNLTTKRYTEADIESFMSRGLVLSVEVSDRFGDSGLTAVAIITFENDTASIDSFLMSCRIIGRSIEYAIVDFLIKELMWCNAKICKTEYIKTFKNEQVEFFFELLGFNIYATNEKSKKYSIDLLNYKFQNIDYIGVDNGTKG